MSIYLIIVQTVNAWSQEVFKVQKRKYIYKESILFFKGTTVYIMKVYCKYIINIDN